MEVAKDYEERCHAWARFAGLLAGADVTAIVDCRGDQMTVQTADPLTPWLLPGALLVPEDHFGPLARSDVASLLDGRLAWVDWAPPLGFRSAVLLAAPPMAPSGRAVLVVSFCDIFAKRNLAMAGLYLSQTPHRFARSGGQRRARLGAA